MSKHRLLAVLAAGVLSAAAGAAVPQPGPFSFDQVEFMPREQRDPAARAFLNQTVVKGMPMASAVAAVRRARTICHGHKDGSVVCSHVSFRRPPGFALEDVSWDVRIYPDAKGAVDRFTVSRTVYGG